MKYMKYVVGLLIFTFGIGLTIQSNFGASPYDALLVGLHKTIGLTVGSWEIIIALLLIFCNAIMERDRPYFLGLITAFVTGFGIDLWLFLLNWLEPATWYATLICFILGLIFTEIGIAIYLLSRIAPMPFDHTTLIVTELTGKSILFSRTLLYFIFFVAAVLFGGPIGIGTILTVILGGPILNLCVVIIEKHFVNKSEENLQNVNS